MTPEARPRTPRHSPEHLEYARRGGKLERAFSRIVHRANPDFELKEEPGFFLTRHAIPSPLLNHVFVTSRPDDPGRILAVARDWFPGPSVPWRLTAGEEWRSLLDEACLAAGLRRGESHPVLVWLDREMGPYRPPEGFRFERVKTPTDLAVFDETFHRANELPATGFWKAEGLLDAPALHLFLGFHEGHPIATGLGVVEGDMTGVWAVATLPEFRGRGVGSAISRSIADSGRSAGARATYLWATPLGFPVYERLGFCHVRNELEWNGGPAPTA